MQLARAVADADAAEIESTARRLGGSRRWLAPVGWAAGTLVLIIRGIRLLLLNWRLTLIQLVPAAWVWLVMYELKRHTLRGAPFRQLTLGGMILLGVIAVAVSIAAFWCNTVFAFAVDDRKPAIAPSARRANTHFPTIASSGLAVGLAIAVGGIVVPRVGSRWLYVLVLGGVLALMLISFVAVPARIIGAKNAKKERPPPREAIGSWAAATALSTVAMTPGFVLDRVGLILLGVSGLHIVGFLLLSIGTALYAAGMSSVSAVKLSMKLATPHSESAATG
ncbi:MAG TPA: hypothetical protein VE442_04575 [Jatrophihabitans sp.]|nr:hypothetical protein [Jatrophihabitans sp.]